MPQQYFAPAAKPYGTITGRLTDSLLVVLPQRVKRPETQIAFAFQNQLRFNEDSDYRLIFSDFASQELMYSAILSQYEHTIITQDSTLGSDPFMKAMLTGSKDAGTDVYSIVAKSVGLKRNQAKGSVLGALYGMGTRSYINTLLQSIESEKERRRVRPIAKKAYVAFKGSKNGPRLEGGIASNFFNYIDKNISSDNPRFGPFGLAYPKSLNKRYWLSRRVTSATNYAVQASCALRGMLSVYITLMNAEINNEINGRYAGSIHDCVIYIVHKDDIEKMAAAMIRSFVSVWAHVFDYFNLGALPTKIITDIVLDVDKEMKKDAFATIKTPEYSTDKTGFQLFVSPETGQLTRKDLL